MPFREKGEQRSNFKRFISTKIREVLPSFNLTSFKHASNLFDSGNQSGYIEYQSSEVRERIFKIGKAFGDYARDNKIDVIIYPDSGARLLAHATNQYLKKAYPKERLPETYFVNPQSLKTKEDFVEELRVLWKAITHEIVPIPSALSNENAANLTAVEAFNVFSKLHPELIEKITPHISMQELLSLGRIKSDLMSKSMELLLLMQTNGMESSAAVELMYSGGLEAIVALSELVGDFGKNVEVAPNRAATLTAFQTRLPGLMKDKNRKVLIADSCIHTGGVVKPLMEILRKSGFTEVKLGVVSKADNDSGITPDMSIFEDVSCYPLGKDTLVVKSPDRIISSRLTSSKLPEGLDNPRESGFRKRREITRIVREHPLIK